MLLTVLALSHDSLLVILRESHILQRVELSLHSCKVFSAQDIAWRPVCRTVNDLLRVLTSLLPVRPSLVEPSSEEEVVHMWRSIGCHASTLRGLFG
jgi:hypothetical protein